MSLNHRLNRSLLRSLGHFPDQSAVALRCFRQAIRAQRRLMKLAPDIFDPGVVQYQNKCRALDRVWRALWEPAFEKVYGPSKNEDRCRNGAETVRFPGLPFSLWPQPRSPTTDLAIECELAQWTASLRAGGQALDFFKKHQAWRMLSFSRIARLLETAFDLARLASGMETSLPPGISEPPDHSQALADLRRAYGNSESSLPDDNSFSPP